MLAQKYAGKRAGWIRFWKKRVGALLPQFLFWSVFTIIVMKSYGGWSSELPGIFKWQWLLGRADYHLYYVPVLLQLYFLFPLLLWLVESLGIGVIAMGFLAQGSLYYVLSHQYSGGVLGELTSSDQQQYILFLSWVYYFLLGIGLGLRKGKLPKWTIGLLIVTMIGGLGWSVFEAMKVISAQESVITATRFTRWAVLVYATGWIGLTLSAKPSWIKMPIRLMWLLGICGHYSYVIYLVHPLFLRLLWEAEGGGLNMQALVVGGMVIGASWMMIRQVRQVSRQFESPSRN